VNSVAFAERSRVAKHECVHASAALLFGVVPDSIRIASALSTGGYTTGEVFFTTAKASIDAVIIACGVRDGHGIRGPNGEGDVYELERIVPDPGRRAEVLEIADRVMQRRQFKAVRNALAQRLQFTDAMGHDEIAKVAAPASLQVSR
jgi:hypothetical protein